MDRILGGNRGAAAAAGEPQMHAAEVASTKGKVGSSLIEIGRVGSILFEHWPLLCEAFKFCAAQSVAPNLACTATQVRITVGGVSIVMYFVLVHTTVSLLAGS